ncbi:MAG TPA: hypothetical protein VM888_06465 [Chitinophagaceae bacterium]|jgi:hypothetical protein|nr:hypothetical protein [Chitinophagaceae bacterium]
MLQEGKTPITILQELMAMLTTRKEACEKILGKSPDEETKAKLTTCTAQSDVFLNALMSELTQFGDAVMGEVERDNAYQNHWRDALKKADAASAMELYETFAVMEGSLAKTYNELVADGSELPDSLQELLKKQAQEIPVN